MQERYLRGEKFKFKDEDGSIKEGGDWYFFDSEKFFDAEVLHKADILDAFSAAASAASATSTTPSIGLPAYPGLVYIGPGIFFSTGGATYEMTQENRATLVAAIKGNAAISWSYSPWRARKLGAGAQSGNGSSSSSAAAPAAITVRVADTRAQLIPDLTLTLPLK